MTGRKGRDDQHQHEQQRQVAVGLAEGILRPVACTQTGQDRFRMSNSTSKYCRGT